MNMTRHIPTLRVRGVAAVEAALLLIPLVILALGIVEAGRALYQYNTIVKSSRDAVRYLTTVQPGTGFATARCLAVYGTPACGTTPLVEGLATTQVSICDSTNCAATHRDVPATGNGSQPTGVMNLVTVTVSGYQFTNFVPLPLPTMTFGPIANTMRQAL